ncbi:unnamed protein product [Durusdinium trenchii]|uniref:Uncharacterized protein n=1 Tax=Durusdinium trenchii TaxID=1381693 RepID=A0ABP0MGF5_9DINO
MGKGGYGKGWSCSQWSSQPRKPWQQQTGWQRWSDDHNHGSQYGRNPSSSLNQLCSGMVSSAWDGVRSGVASAAWKAVETTAGVLMKTYQADKPKAIVNSSAQNMMACLAGKSDELQKSGAVHNPDSTNVREDDVSSQVAGHKLVLSVLELQKEQMQQQSLLQKQLLEMCAARAAAEPAPEIARPKDPSSARGSRDRGSQDLTPAASPPRKKGTCRRARARTSVAKKKTAKQTKAKQVPAKPSSAAKAKGKAKVKKAE